MTRMVFVALAAMAIVGFAGMAQAAKYAQVCQWTGAQWACGDGNTFPQHTSAPPIIVTPVPTVPSNEKPLLSGPRPQ